MTHDLTGLLLRAQNRDTAAYDQVVERFQDMAVGYGYAILGDFQLAEDAAQEAFLEAYHTLPRVQGLQGFPGLLRRIVYKHCDRIMRRSHGYRCISTGAAIELVIHEAAPDPEEQLVVQETQQVVRESMESLPDAERQAVLLYYMSNHSQSEVAAFLDITVDTVKNRLRSARKRLRERLMIVVEDNLGRSRPSRDEHFAESIHRTIAPRRDRDEEAIYRLLEEKLQRPDMAFQARHGRITASHYDWGTSRIVIDRGQIATHLGVYEIRLRLGLARLRVAGINLDYFDPQLDDGAALLDDAISSSAGAMQAHGYDLSIVRTTDLETYGRHGYVPAMPFAVLHRIRTEDLPSEPPRGRLLAVELNDLHCYPGVPELYNRENDGVSMSAERPTYVHGKCPSEPGEFGSACLILDDDGRPVGYFADPLLNGANLDEGIRITDSAGDPEERLRALGEILRGHSDVGEVEFFNLPYDSAMARHLRRRGVSAVAGSGQLAGSIPMRIVNLESTLRHMSLELTRRLQRAGHEAWSGGLRLTAEAETVWLTIAKGVVSVSDRIETANAIEGGQEMVRLLVGTDAPNTVAEEAGLRVQGNAGWLLEALFPPLHPVLPNEYL